MSSDVPKPQHHSTETASRVPSIEPAADGLCVCLAWPLAISTTQRNPIVLPTDGRSESVQDRVASESWRKQPGRSARAVQR